MGDIVDLDKWRPAVDVQPGAGSSGSTSSGGGGTYGGMDVVDAKIAAEAARTDAKFAELRGDVKLLVAKIDGFDKKLDSQRSEIKADFRATRALTVALIALVLGSGGLALAFGGTMFSRGMSVRDVVKAVISEQQAQKPIAPVSPK